MLSEAEKRKRRKHYHANKALHKGYVDTYVEKNRDRVNQQQRDSSKYNRAAWSEWLAKNNFHYCEVCGYDRCQPALDFHHLNPELKTFNIGNWLPGHDLNEANEAILEAELQNCVRLCTNCHREVHHGFISLIK